MKADFGGHEPVIDLTTSSGKNLKPSVANKFAGAVIRRLHGSNSASGSPKSASEGYPADKAGHSADLVISAPKNETFAPWKGSLSDRARRAAGFLSWALDGTKAPQAAELKQLHAEELLDQEEQRLLRQLGRIFGEDMYDDAEFTGAVDLFTPGGMKATVKAHQITLSMARVIDGNLGTENLVLSHPDSAGESLLPEISWVGTEVYGGHQDLVQPRLATTEDLQRVNYEISQSDYLNGGTR